MTEKRVFDFETQLNKLQAVFNKNINTEIMASKTYDAVFSVAENSGGSEFEVVALEKDFLKHGEGIVRALKDAGVKYSVLLFSVADLNFTKPKKIFGLKSSEIIILGGKELISYALFYASNNTKNVHAVLTEPYVEGLLGNTVTVPDGGFVKVITVSKLKTLIFDKTILAKSNSNAVAYSYIKCAGKLITLIDYKLDLLIGEKTLQREHYDRARLAIALINNIKTFANPIEVLAYASLLNAEVLASSNVLTGGGQRNIAHALELQLPTADRGDVALVSLDRAIKLYHAFFVNDFSSVLSVADYTGDVNKISKISNKDSAYFYSNIKIPSVKRKNMLSKLISLTRAGFIKETSQLMSILLDVKKNYMRFKGQKTVTNFKYVQLKNAVQLAPYLTSETTVLTLLRDFGVLNTLK